MNKKVQDKATTYYVFRPTEPHDFDLIDLHSAYDEDPGVIARCKPYLQVPWNYAFTIFSPEGRPLAIVGGFLIYARVMETWSVVDKSILRYRKHYAHALKFLIQHQFEALKLERMQLITKADQPWAERWGKFLGFEKEATMRKYGEENADYFLFAKVRE